jgi:demethylmenaquinone methyltransferase/2-methoxy-6-polyprenyl-1,4-benzoquinol methylase
MLVRARKAVVGLDLTFDYLIASKKRVSFHSSVATAEAAPYRAEGFDAVVSSYLAKYVDIGIVAEECFRVLRPGGRVVFHDFCSPPNSLVHRLWKAYFGFLRFCGVFMPSWRHVFDELDGFIDSSDWESKTANALERSGFRNVRCEYYTFRTAAMVYAEKP